LNTDRWYYRVFQSAPDLIRALLPGSEAAKNELSIDAAAPGDRLYRFEALEIKELTHRLDGVLWPQRGLADTAWHPVVKLELQMQRDTRFKHRLGVQTLRFLQLHPKVRHLSPARLPRQLQLVLDEVIWISLEELGQQDQLDPLLNLLRLPVLHEPELQLSSQQILERRPDLAESVFPILIQRHPNFTLEQMMVVVKFPTQELRHSRAAQELIEEGRQEGRLEGHQQGQAEGRRAEATSITPARSPAAAAPSARPPSPASRRCPWSGWRRWLTPCSISATAQTWTPGWRSTPAERRLCRFSRSSGAGGARPPRDWAAAAAVGWFPASTPAPAGWGESRDWRRAGGRRSARRPRRLWRARVPEG